MNSGASFPILHPLLEAELVPNKQTGVLLFSSKALKPQCRRVLVRCFRLYPEVPNINHKTQDSVFLTKLFGVVIRYLRR